MVNDLYSGSSLRRSRGSRRYRVRAGMICLGLLVVFQNAAGARPDYRPHMTGQQLIHDMKANSRIGQNAVRRERAMGYLDGVMDAGAGTLRCPGSEDLPRELNYEVTDDIALLGPERLRGNAAPLVLAALAAHYPCKPSGDKQQSQRFRGCGSIFRAPSRAPSCMKPSAGATLSTTKRTGRPAKYA